MARLTSLKLLKWDWINFLFLVFGLAIVGVVLYFFYTVVTVAIVLIGYPFYLLYSKLLGISIDPSESFWATIALFVVVKFFFYALANFIERIRR